MKEVSKNNLIVTIIAVIIVGTLGFFGGIQYQKSQGGSFPQGMTQRVPGGNMPGETSGQKNTTGIRPTSGEITSLNQNTLTIKTQDGSSKIIIYSTSTKVNRTSEGSTSDLKTGEQITVIGSESSNGTVTAQSISLGNSLIQGMPAGGQPGQTGQ